MLLAALLRVNWSKEELENHPTVIEGVSAFCLWTTHDPKAAFFGFGKGVDTANEVFSECVAEDDLDASRRRATATMYNLRAKCILETEENVVQSRINVAVSLVNSFHIIGLCYGYKFKITGYIHSIYRVQQDT